MEWGGEYGVYLEFDIGIGIGIGTGAWRLGFGSRYESMHRMRFALLYGDGRGRRGGHGEHASLEIRSVVGGKKDRGVGACIA